MRTLIVGLGGMGKVHCINTRLIPSVEIVGAVGATDDDRKAAEGFSLPFFSSIAEATAAGTDFDTVDITTPTFMHKQNIMEALDAGCRNIIVEKPVALRSADAEALFSRAEATGARIVPAHVMRFTKEFKALAAAVASEEYGRVMAARFSRISAMPGWTGGWLMDREKSGLVPFDLHIHDLDMIFALFGKPLSVSTYKRKSRGSGIEEYFHASYGYDGFTVEAEAAWLRASVPFSASWRIIFEHCVMECDGSSVKSFPDGGSPATVDTHYDTVVETGINVPPTGWYYEELSAIYMYLASDGKTPLIPYSDIVEELKILENP